MPERAFQPRQTFLQNDKARARQLGRGLEIHLAERFAEIEMLLGRKFQVWLLAEFVVLDIALLVGAVRHFIERRVRNGGENIVELLLRLSGSLLQFRNCALQFRDRCHQSIGARLVLGFFRLADLLRRRVARGLRLFERGDGRAAFFIERKEPFRFRRQPAAFKAPIERLRIVADGFDVVHEETRQNRALL